MDERQSVQERDTEIRAPQAQTRDDGLAALLARGTPSQWWRWTLAGAAAIAIGLGVLWMLQLFGRILSLFILGIAIAAAAKPLVDRFSGRVPRAAVVTVLYLLLLILLVALGWLVVSPLAGQLQQASSQIPSLIDQAQQGINALPMVGDVALGERISSILSGLQSQILSFSSQIFNYLFDIVIIIFVSFYALIFAPGALRFLRSLVPEGPRERVSQVLADMGQSMGGYVRGVFIDSFIVGVLTYVGLLLIGVNFPLALAVFSGLMEIIPSIGPIISGIVMVLVALLQSPTLALIVLVFAIILQQIEGNLLVPNIMHQQAKISPLLVLFVVAAGYTVGGFVGALVAIPIAAILRVLVVQVIAPTIRNWTGAPEPEPEAAGD